MTLLNDGIKQNARFYHIVSYIMIMFVSVKDNLAKIKISKIKE